MSNLTVTFLIIGFFVDAVVASKFVEEKRYGPALFFVMSAIFLLATLVKFA
jgi:hypothetical protein